MSSSFSSVMRNGHTHSKGNKIVNDSNKPYLQIDEMLDGNTQHYYIPKSTINTTPHNVSNVLDMDMEIDIDSVSYNPSKPKTRKPSKPSKPKTRKSRKPTKPKTRKSRQPRKPKI